MRNISIVYKKPSKRQQRPHIASMGNINHYDYSRTQPKREMDEYYSRLVQKEKHRERIMSVRRQSMEKIRMRTASQQKKDDQHNIIDTLNIASFPIHGINEQRRDQNKTQLKMFITRKLSIGRPGPSLKGLNIAPLSNPEEDVDSSRWAALKLKCMFKAKIPEQKPTVLALSVNFILNEHYHWQEEQIEQSAIKHWKMLQNYSSIAWICQKESSVKKLVKFSKNNGLRLDGVYHILQKKSKKMLTVNYNLVQTDFGIKNIHPQNGSPLLPKTQDKKMVVVNGLLVQNTNQLQYTGFYNSVPVLKNNRSVIHLTKIDPNDNCRFVSVINILSQEMQPKPFAIMPILRQYELYEQQNKKMENCHCNYDDFAPEQKDILAELQQMKLRLVKYFSQSLSMKMTDRIDDNSTQYLIGDAIRRNYKIFQNYSNFDEEYQYYKYHRDKHRCVNQMSPIGRKRQKFTQKRFNNVVYLWQF